MSNKGRNPFDRTTNLPKDAKPSSVRQPQVLEWGRIRAAQNVAGTQKARTEAALAIPIVIPPKIVFRPVKAAVVPFEVPTKSQSKWTGANIWRGFCFTLWVTLSLAGFAGNFFGGLIISIGLFFVMVFISGMPFFLKGVTMYGGRNNNGKAV
jgi:hypothetical protein